MLVLICGRFCVSPQWANSAEIPPQKRPDLSGLEYLSYSDDFRVWVNGREQIVWKSTKSGNHGSHNIASMSFVNFDLAAPVEIKIAPKAVVRSYALRPYSAHLQSRLADNTIVFSLDKPQNLILVVNDSYAPALILAANPPHRPSRPSDVNYYFGPGVHDIGRHKKLISGDRVYLADGAVVKGSFAIEHARDVRIQGRGIIYNGHFPHEEAFSVIRGRDTQDILIEGITISNSPGWIICFWGGSINLTVRNVKMFGNWWMNTDGVQTGTDSLLVEDCFLQCNDDNFSLNGICRNVEIRNNVLWNLFNGGVFMLGWGTGTRYDVQNVNIHDNVILRAGGVADYDRKAPFSMKLFGSHRTAKNISFRNIVIEDIAPYGRWIDFQAGKASKSSVGNISFENIEVRKTWKVEGEIRGMSPDCPIENISFRNIVIQGKRMTSPQDGGLTLINTRNISIEGQVFTDNSEIRSGP